MDSRRIMLGSGTFIIVSTSLQLENRSLILQQMAIRQKWKHGALIPRKPNSTIIGCRYVCGLGSGSGFGGYYGVFGSNASSKSALI